MQDFKNKTIFITGGSRGIGRAIAEKFALLGANVVITYKSRVDPNYFKPKKILYFKCDSANSRRIKIVVDKAIKKYGKIDVLINNAGITKDGLIMRMTEESWDSVINTNLKSTFLFTKEVLKSMIKNHSGKIINVSSVVATAGNAGQSNYVASKAGMIGLTKALAKELSAYNIQVNAVSPGYVETDMTAKLTEEQREAIFKATKKSAAKPDKVADFIAMLSSDVSDLITGQNFIVEATQLKKQEIKYFKTKI